VSGAGAAPRFGITAVEVRGFRTARDVVFSAGPLCALVGEADAGKSNLLAAIRAVLDPAAAPVTANDAAAGSDGGISIRVELAGGGEYALDGTAEPRRRPSATPRRPSSSCPPRRARAPS
jgi:hypothetical protein